MKTYLLVILALFAFDVVGKIGLIYTRNTHRNLKHTMIDAVIAMVLLSWGMYLWGSLP